jgi:glycosyltransferase involved in cell wall biosynthesis
MYIDEAFYKISIIMPTYNRAAYIIETIKSIQDQTYSNWELIIIDDGSEDNTEELIAQIKDERVLFYKAGRIGVIGKTKNIGLAKANGGFIAFMDSDDLWAPTKLEKQMAALDQYPEAGFSLTAGYNFIKQNEPLEYFYKQTEGLKCENILIPFFKSEVAALMPTLLLRKKCLNTAGRFIEKGSFSDIEFMLSLAIHFKAVVLYEPLLYRRLHNANHSSNNWETGYFGKMELINSYKKRELLPAEIAHDALFRLYINYGEKCLLYKKHGKAINKFLKAWLNKPFSIVPLKKTAKAIVYYLKR